MQWEIIYEEPGTRETYKGEPGRLYTPVPRSNEELLEALKFILARFRPVRITLIETEATKL